MKIIMGLILGIFVFMLGLSFGKNRNALTNQDVQNDIRNKKQNMVEMLPNKCKLNVYEGRGENFFEKYTVQPGDTLLSIAKNRFQDTSKATDIVFMNKYRYESLSLAKPFIEKGWVLLLPPDGIDVDKDEIRVSQGLINSIKENIISLQVNNQSIFYFYPDPSMLIESGIKSGDCVNVVHQWYGTKEVFKISFQNK